MPRLRKKTNSASPPSSNLLPQPQQLQRRRDTPRQQVLDGHNPLLIPELLINVTQAFDRRTLCQCMKVCRSWYFTLHSTLWSDLDLVIAGERLCPNERILKKNASLVRKLHIRVNCELVIGEPLFSIRSRGSLLAFPNLVVLKINTDRYSLGRKRYNQNLVTNMIITLFCHANRGHLGNLQEVQILHVHWENPNGWMTQFERLWSRLRVLSLSGGWWTDHDLKSESNYDIKKLSTLVQRVGQLTSIQDLSISTDCISEPLFKVQAWIIEQCPNLTRLRWRFGESRTRVTSMSMMAEEMQSPGIRGEIFRLLETLTFARSFSNRIDYAVLVGNIHRLTELKMNFTAFGAEEWKYLHDHHPRHLKTLTLVDITRCNKVSGETIQGMLCSLPALEVFRADQMSDMDIAENGPVVSTVPGSAATTPEPEPFEVRPRPWVCYRLRELSLAFKLQAGTQRAVSQKMILSRLSTLNYLENLVLFSSDLNLALDSEHKSLGDGSDLLRGLGRLRRVQIDVSSSLPSWHRQVLEWTRGGNCQDLDSLKDIPFEVEVKVMDRFMSLYHSFE